MVNSLRHYHLGCGERLQALSPLVELANKLTFKKEVRPEDKAVNEKMKEQH